MKEINFIDMINDKSGDSYVVRFKNRIHDLRIMALSGVLVWENGEHVIVTKELVNATFQKEDQTITISESFFDQVSGKYMINEYLKIYKKDLGFK